MKKKFAFLALTVAAASFAFYLNTSTPVASANNVALERVSSESSGKALDVGWAVSEVTVTKAVDTKTLAKITDALKGVNKDLFAIHAIETNSKGVVVATTKIGNLRK